LFALKKTTGRFVSKVLGTINPQDLGAVNLGGVRNIFVYSSAEALGRLAKQGVTARYCKLYKTICA